VVTAEGVEGLTVLDEAETANALVPEIKALGIETIVVLIHEGGAATGLYNKCDGISGRIFDVVKNFDPEIDVVVSGHTNAAHICNLDGRLVTSAAHNGRLVSAIDLIIDEKTGDVTKMSAENVVVTRDVAKDPAQSDLIAKWKALIAPIANRVAATIAADLKRALPTEFESPLGNLIADAQLAATAAQGAEVAFMNPGGIRTDLVFAQVSGGEQAGEVTYAELFAVQPFSNNLVTFQVTGTQILHALEEQWYDFGGNKPRVAPAVLAVSSTLSYAFVASDATGHRVDAASVKIGGQPLDLGRTYRVTANVFLAGGGDSFPSFKAGTNRVSGPFDLEALEAWMKSHPAAPAPALGRLVAR
jgi:5'-nucleotidase